MSRAQDLRKISNLNFEVFGASMLLRPKNFHAYFKDKVDCMSKTCQIDDLFEAKNGPNIPELLSKNPLLEMIIGD